MTKKQKQLMEATEKNLLEVAKKYRVKVSFDHPYCGEGHGYTDGREIFLGEMKCTSALIMIFCHELGHILSFRRWNKSKSKCKVQPSIYEQEFTAWAEAIRLMREEGGIRITQEDAHYIHACLDTYRLYNVKSNF